jgi:hypothetical protein
MNAYRQWFFKSVLIVMVGIVGWSCAENQSLSRAEQKRLGLALKHWGNTEKKTCDIVDVSDQKDFTVFKHEFGVAYRELIDAHTEFDEISHETKDEKLKAASSNCSVEMSKIEEDIGLIYAYYEDYQRSRELSDANNLVVDEGAKMNLQDALNRYRNQKNRYIEQRSEARRQILKSGVL